MRKITFPSGKPVTCVPLLILLVVLVSSTASYAGPRDDVRSYSKLLDFAETILGKDGIADRHGEERLDALIDLHVKFCTEVLGKPVPSQRVFLVKQGIRLFLSKVPERYSGDGREATLRLIKDIIANRAVFVELLTSDSPPEAIEEQMIAYLTRNQQLSYKEPIPIAGQVSVPNTDTPLQLVAGGIRLIKDEGTHGHYNKAIDAGETVTLNIPLKNFSTSPYRSTSGFLQSSDEFVKPAVNEVIYSEKRVVDGETVVFAPGTAITPRQNYTFSISPLCPDGHTIRFELLIMDSDHRGEDFRVPFTITVYNVGPLDFGNAVIDDDMPGPSDGNANAVIEPGETVEYVLAIRNRGAVTVSSISATLFSSQDWIRFSTGGDRLSYSKVEARSERPIPASFIFSVSEDYSLTSGTASLRLLTEAEARGFAYSWVRVNMHEVGVTDEHWAEVQQSVSASARKHQYAKVEELLENPRLQYRLSQDEQIKGLLRAAKAELRKGEAAEIEARRRKAEEERQKRLAQQRAKEREAEQRRLEAEREKIASTPIAEIDLGSQFVQQPNDITSRLEGRIPGGYTDSWSYKFTDREGREHSVTARLVVKGNRFSGSYPIWSLTVDGNTVTKTMKGYGHWPGEATLRIDPIIFRVETTGRTSRPAVRIKPALYRTDYGMPQQIKYPPKNFGGGNQ